MKSIIICSVLRIIKLNIIVYLLVRSIITGSSSILFAFLFLLAGLAKQSLLFYLFLQVF